MAAKRRCKKATSRNAEGIANPSELICQRGYREPHRTLPFTVSTNGHIRRSTEGTFRGPVLLWIIPPEPAHRVGKNCAAVITVVAAFAENVFVVVIFF